MRVALCRTAFSPIIYEMTDFAAALYDPKVRLLAQGRALPLFLGTLGACVETAVERLGGAEVLEPGDVIVTTYSYEGQEHALTVDVEVDAAGKVTAEPAGIEAVFTTAYERAFGHGLPEPIQVVAVRVTSRELLPQHEAPVVTATEASENEPVEAYSARLGTVTTFAVLDRDALAVGSATAGPAIVLEPTATTYVDSGERIVIDPTGHMIVERVA